MSTFIIDLGYFIGTLFFVLGLRKMNSPDTARKGNIWAAIGMALAIIAAFFQPIDTGDNNYLWILGGLVIGSGIGFFYAKKVELTAMPQLVSLFNGFGGACAVLLGLVELYAFYNGDKTMDAAEMGIVFFTLIVGAVSFTGSLLAYLKLDGKIKDKNITFNGHNILNIVLLLANIAIASYLVVQGDSLGFIWAIILLGVALIYGFSFVAPIGGADMPVVISLLNSFTGLTAAAAGLIYGNQLMIVGGILVGASGTILTVLMCNAMNRSLLNVIIGSFGSSGAAAKGTDGDKIAKEVSVNDAAIQLFYSKSVIIVPGYGLAVAQAQKACKELDDMLEANGVEVRYAIHPVAGRMPGHMNVLLAEADVPYPKLIDLETANEQFPNTDIVVVVGANDVVNPSAKDDPSSNIYGMPVLEVWESKNVIVMKRSMRPGYAGIQNPLFFNDNTKMLFGDAKTSMQNLAAEVKNL